MSDSNSIINLGDISKPAVVLFEKISEAIGGLYKPTQIIRIASAEAKADKIKAVAAIEINELQQRAVQRFVLEEAKKQENIEAITTKALPYLNEEATPANVEDDWIVNFFDKCRLISDEQMQLLWARLLAEEANFPGSYSKHTIGLLSSLEKSDAILFNSLLGFGWFLGDVSPLIYDEQASIYTDADINFNSLEHLDDIGLISFNPIGYSRLKLSKYVCTNYYGTQINIDFPGENENSLETGKILLTRSGQELATICSPETNPDFIDYVLNIWKNKGLIVSSPYPHTLQVDKNS